jgi:hypothetical protein
VTTFCDYCKARLTGERARVPVPPDAGAAAGRPPDARGQYHWLVHARCAPLTAAHFRFIDANRRRA